MKHSKTLNKISLLAIVSAVTSTAAMATPWDASSNPSYFNTPYNVTHYVTNLSQLPSVGVLSKEKTPWSDSYWPKQRGAFAYRYRQFENGSFDETMTDQQRQTEFFGYHLYSKAELKQMSMTDEGKAIIDTLSPLEKYSIYIGDFGYSLVKKYAPVMGGLSAHPDWEGYCHDWAPVATHYSEPQPKFVMSDDGIPLNFGSSDIKALIMADYQDAREFTGLGNFERRLNPNKIMTSYIGRGCPTNVNFIFPTLKVRNGLPEMADYPDTNGDSTQGVPPLMDGDLPAYIQSYQNNLALVLAKNPTSPSLPENARQIVADKNFVSETLKLAAMPECQGVNAGTFHIVISNQLGLMDKGFEFDKTRDGQIWNQPARGFSSKIVDSKEVSGPGNVRKIVTVETILQFADDTEYGWAFVNPTVGGLATGFDLTKSVIDPAFAPEYDVYSRMLIKQGDETQMNAYPYNMIDTAQYKYTLDLDASGNIIGGDWLTLDRPDTLWIMKPQPFKGTFKRLGDLTPAQYN
jgi:hypothetical protein